MVVIGFARHDNVINGVDDCFAALGVAGSAVPSSFDQVPTNLPGHLHGEVIVIVLDKTTPALAVHELWLCEHHHR
jgi:hypothetical protein